MKNKERGVIGWDESVIIIVPVKRSDSSLVVGRDSFARERKRLCLSHRSQS